MTTEKGALACLVQRLRVAAKAAMLTGTDTAATQRRTLDQLVTDLRSDIPVEKKYTGRRVILDLEPQTYTAEQVKETRKLLNASQTLFAQFLGGQ